MKQLSLIVFLVAFIIDFASSFTLKRNTTDEKLHIYGGFTVALGQRPFQVVLKKNGILSCGGCLITTQHVLTAAHCLKNLTPNDRLSVVAGTIYRDYGGTEIYSTFYAVHPDYSPTTFLNDIGVIKVQHSFVLSEIISVIPLPKQPVVNNELVTIAGLGRYSDATGDSSQAMKTYTVPVIDNGNCHKLLPGYVTDSDICDVVAAGNGVCSGDSGSPLVNARNEVVGVASRVMMCAKQYPNIYSSVYYNLGFIYSQIAQ